MHYKYWYYGIHPLELKCLLFLGTDIILWHGKSGKILGTVDTNQLKNTMATISPNGRFLAAAAFTADVKVGFLGTVYWSKTPTAAISCMVNMHELRHFVMYIT